MIDTLILTTAVLYLLGFGIVLIVKWPRPEVAAPARRADFDRMTVAFRGAAAAMAELGPAAERAARSMSSLGTALRASEKANEGTFMRSPYEPSRRQKGRVEK